MAEYRIAARVAELDAVIRDALEGGLHAPLALGTSTEEAAESGCPPCQGVVALRELERLMDALLAERQRLRDALNLVVFTAPYGSKPYKIAQKELGTPSAAQTLEDPTPDKEKAGS